MTDRWFVRRGRRRKVTGPRRRLRRWRVWCGRRKRHATRSSWRSRSRYRSPHRHHTPAARVLRLIVCWCSGSTSAAPSLSLRSDLSLCAHSPALCCVQILMPKHADSLEAVCAAAARTAQDQDASVVMLVTETGEAPRMTAKYRPRVPIVACCPNEVRHSGRDMVYDIFAESCMMCLWPLWLC